MLVLYVTNTLIMIRSIFRMIEYAQGNNGYLLRYEVFLYVFDAVPMFAVMVAYFWKYPDEISRLLREGYRNAGDVETGGFAEEQHELKYQGPGGARSSDERS